MPIPTPKLQFTTGLTIGDFGYSQAEVTSAVTGMTLDESPMLSLSNAIKLGNLSSSTESQLLSQEQANSMAQELGFSLDVPSEGIRESAFNFLMDRKKEKARRELALSSEANEGRTMKNIGLSIVASFADPLNIATAFVPAVGVAKLAKTSATVAKAFTVGGQGTKLSLRGVAAESVAGAALAESIVLPSQRYLQSDYTMYDSLINVGVGTAFAGLLHGVARGVGNIREAEFNRRKEIYEKQKSDRLERQKALAEGREPSKLEPDTPEQVFSDKMLGASPETREAVLHALIARAVTGKDIDIGKIIDADIDAFAARQVFELDELEITLDENFDIVFEEFNKLNSEQFLGKRKSQRNKKLIKELESQIKSLYNKDAWVDYRANARKQLKGNQSKEKIRKLAQSMQDEAKDEILFKIQEIRERLEIGRNAKEVKSALDRLQQTTTDYSFIKQSVIEQSKELQAKIDAHPETLRRAQQESMKYGDPKATTYSTPSRSKEMDERVNAAAKSDENDELDMDIETAREKISERYGDTADEAVFKDIEEQQAAELKKAEAIVKSKSCILG